MGLGQGPSKVFVGIELMHGIWEQHVSSPANPLLKRTVVRFSDADGEDIVFTHGRGCHVFDRKGRRFLDCVLGYGPVVLGHADERFTGRVASALGAGIHFPGFSDVHDEYVARLVAASGLTSAVAPSFMKTSSEANTAAIRVASLVTGRKGVLRCGFTGWHDSQHAQSPSWHAPPRHRMPLRNTEGLRGVSGDEQVFNWISLDPADLSALLETNGHRIACFILDAFQFAFVERDLLLHAIAECRRHGILIVLDETKTAGRVSPIGVAGNCEDAWDMLVLGKAIGNGAPLSMLLVKEAFRDAALKAQVGGTHAKELLSVHCALATMDRMQEADGYRTLGDAGSAMADQFNACARQLGLSEVLTLVPVFGGSVLDIRMRDDLYSNASLLRKLQASFLAHGVLLLVGHPFFVSLAHDGAVDQWRDRFLDAIGDWWNAISHDGMAECSIAPTVVEGRLASDRLVSS
jgi:glutamate-1-semialdehyde 2,1-aminomutase